MQRQKIIPVKVSKPYRIENSQLTTIFAKNNAMHTDKSDEFYKRLKVQLEDTSTWPSDYLYKFIVPTAGDKIKRIQDIFDNMGAVIESKQSKKGTYTSVSITVNLKNAAAVIEKYRQVGEVEGVISL